METKRLFRKLIPALAAAAVLSGCHRDTEFAAADGGKIYIDLDLVTPLAVSRAASAADEYRIRDLSVLLFDADGKLIAVPAQGQISLTEPGDVRRVKIALDKQAYKDTELELTLLANMSGNVDLSAVALDAGRRKEDILLDLKFTADSAWPTDGDSFRPFPMYGTAVCRLNTATHYKSVNMLRAVARVQFTVNGGQGLTYDNDGSQSPLLRMKSLHVYYSRKGGYAAPLVQFTNEMKYVSTPSSTESFVQRTEPEPLAYYTAAGQDYSFLRSVYLPENNNVNPAAGQNPVRIVVGGYYKDDSAPTYYAVDFEQDGAAYDLLRNHTYDFNIVAVARRGDGTPEGALGQKSVIGVRIAAWSETDVAEANPNLYELSVSKSMFSLDHNPHTETFDVSTTYFTGEWQIDPDSFTAPWFAAAKNDEGTGVAITVGENTSDALRNGYFTVSSGKLTKKIYVSQLMSRTANCYVVAEPGLHGLIATTMGNGVYGTDVGGVNLASMMNSPAYGSDGSIDPAAIKEARLIWQSRPGLISHIGPEDDGDPLLSDKGILNYVVGEPLEDEAGGNAVIGIYDPSGNVLWSWHIWVVWGYSPEDSELLFLTRGVCSGFYFMDRNLGAMNNSTGDAKAYGLLYQWGRKDPMRTSNVHRSTVPATTYDFAGANNSSSWHTATGFQDILSSARYPMSYTTKWGTGGGNSTSAALWGNPNGSAVLSGNKDTGKGSSYNGTEVFNEGQKTIFDPCPPGYRVPSINGFYFGISGSHAECVHTYNGKAGNQRGYADIADDGYLIYYYGQYAGYEKYSTWMPMAPFYAGTTALVTTDGSEDMAFTWLNAGATGANAYPVIWHPKNNHIHNYGKDTEPKVNGGTIRCVRETDTERVEYTVPRQIVLLNPAGSDATFAVLSGLDWHIEQNNLTYDWLSLSRDGDYITVTATQQNPGLEDRAAYIYIVFGNGDKFPVKILQNGFDPGMSAEKITVAYQTGSTGNVKFTLPAGVSCSITEGSDWFDVTLSSAGTAWTAAAKALFQNIGTTPPQTVTLTTNYGEVFTIDIVQAVDQRSLTDKTSIAIDKAAGRTQNLNITNIDASVWWSVAEIPSFVSAFPASGTAAATIVITTTEANGTGSARSGDLVIRFTVNGVSVDRVVTISQNR